MSRLLVIGGVLVALAITAGLLLVQIRDAREATERVAYVGLAGVVFAALAGTMGVLLGSWIAAGATRQAAAMAGAQAEADRQAAHRARLSDRLIAITSDALVRSEGHRGQIWKQFHARNAVAAGKDRPESIPEVEQIELGRRLTP